MAKIISSGITNNCHIPQLRITVPDNTTDTTPLRLTCDKNDDVRGEITWSCNLQPDLYRIEGDILSFVKHFEGTFTLTATASNTSDTKTITVTCDEEATITYILGTIATPPTVEAAATSATINYTIIPIYTYKLKPTITGSPIDKQQEVTFAQNPTNEDVTRNGSFTDDKQILVNWEVIQRKDDTIINTAYTLNSIAETQTVKPTATTANIDYSVVLTTSYSLGRVESGTPINLSHKVSFEENYSDKEVTRNGTFTDEYHVIVNWKVNQEADKIVSTVYTLNSVASAPTVEYITTTANITYSIVLVTTYESGRQITGNPFNTSYTVTFAENLTYEDTTKTGQFTDKYGVTVNWEVKQKAAYKYTFRFTASEPSTLALQNYSNSPKVSKSNDGFHWETWDYSSINLAEGATVYIKGENPNGFSRGLIGYQYCYSCFAMTGIIECKGNIMDLLGKNITKIPNSSCFYQLFRGCASLATAPELLATTLASSGYSYMFYNCTRLTTAPELPATTLADSCYYAMFIGCSNLTTAPSILPATTLADNCYYSMFYNCYKLTTAPELPAATLANNCYNSMFYYCTSLTTAPKLLATTLGTKCYYHMFDNCTSLTTAPSILPAKTLAEDCYNCMFYGCSGLTTAPELPATTLADGCYSGMFYKCTSLTTAPSILPATTLTNKCYYNMFNYCTSLTRAPELPATTLVDDCYYGMFQSCSSLNYVKAMFITTPSEKYTWYWLYWVPSTGTFVKNATATWDVSGGHGIPAGWTVETAVS